MIVVAMAVVLAAVGLRASSGPAEVQAPGDPVKGLKVYADMKCSLCHKIGTTGGKLGPDLSKVGSTRDAAWLTKYIPNPKAMDPKFKMPIQKVAGQKLTDLVAYMLTLKAK
jgi:cytochrome c2